MSKEEMEVPAQMATEVSTAEWERVQEILEKSVLGRDLIAKGEEKGKIEAKQDSIQKFLLQRFNAESSEVQREIRQLNDLRVLDNVLTDMFASTSLKDALDIISAGVVTIAGKSKP
jgi:hypothetical protein